MIAWTNPPATTDLTSNRYGIIGSTARPSVQTNKIVTSAGVRWLTKQEVVNLFVNCKKVVINEHLVYGYIEYGGTWPHLCKMTNTEILHQHVTQDGLSLCNKVPERPCSGTLIMYNRHTMARRMRKDGHEWVKKSASNRSTREVTPLSMHHCVDTLCFLKRMPIAC